MTYYNDTLGTDRLKRPEPNTNEITGIRYGIISANSLHSDVIDDIQSSGRDIHYEEMCEDIRANIKSALSDYRISNNDLDQLSESAIEMIGWDWEDDEPVHEFDIDGVKGRTTWLGGALMVWVFESPIITQRGLCSPCVPNCGDLDSKFNDEGGYECYDVPPDWRDEE